MFTSSDIRTEAYRMTYRKGKELFERGGVQDFSYDIYREEKDIIAEISARVRGNERDFYQVEVTVDESFSEVAGSRCDCAAYYNYEGICKHCVAALFAYVNRRQAKEILELKGGSATSKNQEAMPPMRTAPVLRNLLGQYSMRAGSSYLIPENIYGKVELVPYFKIDYSYGRVEFKIGAEMK